MRLQHSTYFLSLLIPLASVSFEIHTKRAFRWVFFLSGVAHITLPHSSDEAFVVGGKHGGILALDTADVSADGHITVYPTNEVTTVLELPFADGKVPPHVSLHDGPCTAEEQNY